MQEIRFAGDLIHRKRSPFPLRGEGNKKRAAAKGTGPRNGSGREEDKNLEKFLPAPIITRIE